MRKILSFFVIFALACEPVVVQAAQQQLLAGAPSEATASPDFATLEGIPAEALSADEMALVEGKQFRRFFTRRNFRIAITALIGAGGVAILLIGNFGTPQRPLPPIQPLPSSGGVPIPPPRGTPPGTVFDPTQPLPPRMPMMPPPPILDPRGPIIE